LREMLPGSRRKTFEIASLAFRKQRVKCERTLPASANACHHDKLISRDVDVDVPQIVYSSTAYANPLTRNEVLNGF